MKDLDVVHLIEKSYDHTWMHSKCTEFLFTKKTHSRYILYLYKVAFSKTFDIFFVTLSSSIVIQG